MKIQTKKFLCLEIAAVILAIAFSALSAQLSAENTPPSSTATDNRPPPPGGRPPMPPPEALQACSGKTAGVACSFTGREGTAIEGQCFGPPPAPRDSASAAAPSSGNGNSDANRTNSGNAALACRPNHGMLPPPPASATK